MPAPLKKAFIPGSVTDMQARDTGMAFSLIFLLIGYFNSSRHALVAAALVLFATMLCPALFKQPGRLWFGLSNFLGSIASRIVLAVLFYAIVTPVGLLRRVMGADALLLKQWKKGRSSVFRVRDHAFTADDLKNPF